MPVIASCQFAVAMCLPVLRSEWVRSAARTAIATGDYGPASHPARPDSSQHSSKGGSVLILLQ